MRAVPKVMRVLLTTRELGARTGVKTTTLRSWTRKGWVPFGIDTNGRRLFDGQSIVEVLKVKQERARKRRLAG